MADKYTIPFGVDSTDFFDGIKKMDAGVDSLTESVDAAAKTMQKGFEQSAAASDKLDKSLIKTGATTTDLAAKAGALGKDLGNALGGKNIPPGLEDKLKNFTNLMTKFTTAAGKKVAFNIDTAKLEYFEKLLTEGANDLKVLAEVSAYAKTQLAGLDPNSEEFAALSQQVEIADSFLKELGETTDVVINKTESLKPRLREIKNELAQLEIAGKGDTEQFRKLAQEAGELEDQIGDVSARVRVLASDTKYIDAGIQAITGLAGAFTLAQGAASLFGSENEDVQKAIQKVTAAMAILQGIQAISNALNKDSALSVLFFSKAQKTATATTEGLTVATATFSRVIKGIGLAGVIGLFLELTGVINIFGSSQSDAAIDVDKLTKALEAQRQAIQDINDDLAFNASLDIEKLKQAGKDKGEIFAVDLKTAKEQQENLNNSLTEALNKRGEIESRQQAINNALREAGIKQVKKSGKEKLDAELEAINTEVATRTDLVKKGEQNIAKLQAEEKTRVADEGRAQAKADAAKALELQRQINDQQISFTRQLAAENIAAIQNEAQREREQVNQKFNEREEDLKREIALTVQAEDTLTKLLAQLAINRKAEIDKIDKKEIEDAAALELTKQKLLNEFQTEGAAKELETIRLNYNDKRKEVEEQFKEDVATRKRLIRLLNQAEADEVKKVQNENELRLLKEEEERQILLVEIASKYSKQSVEVERQKQIAILEVKVQAAENYLNVLLAQGNAENSLVVLQAKKTIQELKKALNIAVKENDNQPFDLFKFLGLGDLSDEEKEAVVGAVRQSLSSITQITDFIVGQYQRQIDKRQEMIDFIDESISDLESQLEREKELQEAGFANNVGLIEAEIAEKKRAREEEIKQQEELQRKQRAVQRAQLALDTISQTSNLITSATQIFKALSGIPFIGVPLAIATIGLMTGAFVAAKVKAFQLVNSGGQQFGEGGEIEGKPHSQGGKKYFSQDGTGIELEGGEYVINKKDTAKHKALLEAINDDRLSGMSDESLKHMLASMGIHFNHESGKEALSISKDRDEYRDKVFLMVPGKDNGDMGGIANDVKYLADRKRQEVERWEDDNFYYEKKGSTTTKTPKK